MPPKAPPMAGRGLQATTFQPSGRTKEEEKMAIEKHYIAGRSALKVFAEGTLFNVSMALDAALQRYSPQGFIGDFCFPVISVGEQIGTIPAVAAADLRLLNVDRAPGVEGNRVMFDVTSIQGIARSRSLSTPIPVEIDFNTDPAWRLRESTALYLRDLWFLAKEARCASIVNSSTIVFLPFSAWNAGGNAFGNIETIISAVASASGLRPDRVAFGTTAWASFAGNSSTISRCGGWVTVARAAEALRVSSIGIGEARHNIGAGTDRKFVPTFPADKVLVFHGGGPENTFSPRWGISMNWKPKGLQDVGRLITELHPLSRRNQSTMVEVHAWESEIVTDPSLGAVLAGCNSAQSGGI